MSVHAGDYAVSPLPVLSFCISCCGFVTPFKDQDCTFGSQHVLSHGEKCLSLDFYFHTESNIDQHFLMDSFRKLVDTVMSNNFCRVITFLKTSPEIFPSHRMTLGINLGNMLSMRKDRHCKCYFNLIICSAIVKVIYTDDICLRRSTIFSFSLKLITRRCILV